MSYHRSLSGMGQGPRPPTFMWPWRTRDPNAPPGVDTVYPNGGHLWFPTEPAGELPELSFRYQSPLQAGGLPAWWDAYLKNYPWLPWLLILAAGVVAYRVINR